MATTLAESSPPPGRELKNQPTRSAVAIQGWGSVLFGVPFLAAGVFIIGLTLDWFGDQSASMHAPRWVIALCGGLFCSAGLFMLSNGLLSLRLRRRTARFRAKFPEEAWAWDYPWHPEHSRDSGARGVFSAALFAFFWWALLIPFNYLMFVEAEIPFPFNLVIILFDLIGVGIAGHAVYLLMRVAKYGTSELRFTRFPYLLGEPMEAILVRRGPLATIPEITATLRCVQERYEIRRSGNDRSHVVVSYELHAERLTIREERGADFHLRFSLPDSAPPTRLSERPARYWEIHVAAETPGVDYGARFLVPVYEEHRDASVSRLRHDLHFAGTSAPNLDPEHARRGVLHLLQDLVERRNRHQRQ